MGLGLENPLHILIVLLVLLLLFGAKRLPEMGRGLGRGLHEFRENLTGRQTDPLPGNEGRLVATAETATKTRREGD
jgi:sec-independent protein translocase protein TatA